jgi:thymidylate kinase
MRLFFIGCEYAGTTTLANAVYQWGKEKLGIEFGGVHDHWKIPHMIGHPPDLSPEEQEQVLALTPKILEAFQRHNLYYHTPTKPDDGDFIIVGYYIEDTIYSQLYYNYGGEQQAGDRIIHSKNIERQVLTYTPQIVLIHVTATPEVIAKRMKENPHPHSLVPPEDIELVLRRFDEEYKRSGIPRKFTIDTSNATVEESLAEFVRKIEPYLTNTDRLRMLTPPNSLT